MSTPFVFYEQLPECYTVAATDKVLVWDTSASRMKVCTISTVTALVSDKAVGDAATSVIGFYGETGVDRGTYAGTALTALATATISAGNAAGVWAWATSTMAAEFVTRAKQAQVDLKTLMTKINSVGLVKISGGV